MNLTRFTDYSLRVLLYAGAKPDGRCSVQEISEVYGISRNHVVKVVHHLGRLGYIVTLRGRGGGLRLGKDPAEIGLAEVVRATEPGFDLLECFDPELDHCVISSACGLKGVLKQATAAFLAVLERYTLADLLANRKALGKLLATRPPA